MSSFRDPFSQFNKLNELFEPPRWFRQVEEVAKALRPPPFLEEMQRVNAMLAPVVPEVFTGVTKLLEVMRPQFPVFEDLFADIQRSLQWLDEAPEKLVEAFADAGVVPHPDLSLHDIRELVAVFEEHGVESAVALALELHEKLLASPRFRKDVRERWETAGRWQIFGEVFAAFDARLYAVAIPAALAQVDGIVAEVFGLKGLRQDALLARVEQMHDPEGQDLYLPLVKAILAGMLEKFEHGEPIARLNRHAVLHGADRSYATRANAIAVIVWVDYVVGIAASARKLRAAEFRKRARAWYAPEPLEQDSDTEEGSALRR